MSHTPPIAGLWLAAPRPGTRSGWAATLAAGVVVAGFALASGPADPVPPAAENPPAATGGDRLPNGAVARLGWSPHLVGNSAFALTPDEKEIVAVSPEGVVRRFDANTGKLLERRQLTPRDDVWHSREDSATLSADGSTAVIVERLAGEYRLTVWDVRAGRVLFRQVPEKGASVGAFALSRDGRRLALREKVGDKALLRVYDTVTGKRSELAELERDAYRIQFSADASRIVASERGTGGHPYLSCFDVAAGKQLWTLLNQCDRFALSRDARTVIYARYDFR